MRFSILLHLIICISICCNAQNEYDLLGKGARAAGMAYAFNAIADDASALSWNPAGIVQIKKPQAAFSNRIRMTNYSSELWIGREYKPIYMVDFLGFVYPLKIRDNDLGFGINFQNRMDLKSSYSTIEELNANFFSLKSNITVNSISLSGAFSLTSYLAIGLSVNQWFSLGNMSDEYKYFYSNNGREFNEWVQKVQEKTKYTGLNFTTGLFLNLSSFNIPLRFSLKYDNRFTLKNDYRLSMQDIYVYPNGVDTTWEGKLNGIAKYQFPGLIATGLSYSIGDYCTLAFDYDIKPFKHNNIILDYIFDYSYSINNQKILLSETSSIDSTSLLESDENINQIRIGAEYLFHPSFALIPLRIGWKNNPTSISSFNINKLPEKQVYAWSFNFGTGITTTHIIIDLAYERYCYKRMDSDFFSEKEIDHYLFLSTIIYFK